MKKIILSLLVLALVAGFSSAYFNQSFFWQTQFNYSMPWLTSNVTSFPLFVNLSAYNSQGILFSNQSDSGSLFNDYDGPDFNNSGMFWVSVTLPNNTNSTGFFYTLPNVTYSNTTNASGVWANYFARWSASNPVNGSGFDSTDNRHNLNGLFTVNNTSNLFGPSFDFNGNNVNASISDWNNTNPNMITIEMWFRPNGTWGNPAYLFDTYGNASYISISNGSPAITTNFSNNRSAPFTMTTNMNLGFTQGKWSYIVYRYDGSTQSLWVNGTLITSNQPPGRLNFSSSQIFWGGDYLQNAATQANGELDEMRISMLNLSDDYIRATYNMSLAKGVYIGIANKSVGWNTSNIVNATLPTVNNQTAGANATFTTSISLIQTAGFPLSSITGYVFEFDNGSGVLVNSTPITVSPQGLNMMKVNFNETLNFTPGSIIRARFYVNDSFGDIGASPQLVFSPSGIIFFPFDEVTQLPLLFNVTNAPTSTGVQTTIAINANYLNITAGNATQGSMFFSFSGNSSLPTNYNTRRRYYTIGGTTAITDNVYLINLASSNTVQFIVKALDASGAGLSNANISLLKVINGKQYTLATVFTTTGSPSDGIASFYCNNGDSYTVAVVATNGATITSATTCTSNGITVSLPGSGTGQAANYTSSLNTTTVAVSPSSFLLSVTSTNITMYINNSLNALNYWGFRIKQNATVDNTTGTVFEGSSQIFNINVTTLSGGGIAGYVLNTTAFPGNYSVMAFWQVNGFPQQNFTYFYYPANYVIIANSSNVNLANGLLTIAQGLSPITKIVIAVSISALATAAVSTVSGIGGGIVAVGFLAFFAGANFIPGGVFAVVLLIALGLFMMRVAR